MTLNTSTINIILFLLQIDQLICKSTCPLRWCTQSSNHTFPSALSRPFIYSHFHFFPNSPFIYFPSFLYPISYFLFPCIIVRDLQATSFATEVSDTQHSSAHMRVRALRTLTSICYSYRVGKKPDHF